MVRGITPPPAWKDEEGEPTAAGDDGEVGWRGGRKPAIVEGCCVVGATRGAEDEAENGARTGCSSWPGTSPSKSSRSAVVVDADPARWRAGRGAVGIDDDDCGWCWFGWCWWPGRCRAPVV
jgi:hypothetical protein